MTRTVALGAVIGFALTILALALWERSVPEQLAGAASVDAGPPQVEFPLANPAHAKTLVGPDTAFVPTGERRLIKATIEPNAYDAGAL